ncbi:hypothetical protein [Paenarthrobacter aurescens]|uniref:Uncharacterized protein n=1 Tax=Paenarthrobacter aurescens (strain TC1) TaxID=290340 RepID=A1R3B6_PAEAT|nr:hypothetical protein [Paenarthrobacter aurescens]ABM09979.1 hypothetical protein AAur_0938 [Paenarthrobacter aurescens TC1]
MNCDEQDESKLSGGQMMLRGGLVRDEFRRRPLVALTALIGVACIIVALVLPFI